MNILIVLPYIPYPIDSGGKRRILNILKQLSKENKLFIFSLSGKGKNYDESRELNLFSEEINVFCNEDIKDKSLLSLLFSREPEQFKYFRSQKMKSSLNNFLKINEIDLIIVEEIHMNKFVYDINSVPKILSRQKVESLYLNNISKISSSIAKRLYFKVQARKFYKYERASYPGYKKIIVPSQGDKNYIISQGVAQGLVEVIPNGVDTDYFAFREHKVHNPPVFVFNGTFDYIPNIDAVNYFLKKIYPVLRYNLGKFKLLIVGRYGKERFSNLKGSYPEIEITGFVDDIREYLYTSDLFLCPLRIGGGTRLKILEAMSCGLPVVSTIKGSEGLNVRHRKNIILTKNREEFVSEVMNILTASELYSRISKSAREFIENNFSWDIIGKSLNEIIKSINEI